MTRDRLRTARSRAVALGALAALAFPACASDRSRTVTDGPGGVIPARVADEESTRTASAPLGYPWATGDTASLPTASAKAPTGSVVR